MKKLNIFIGCFIAILGTISCNLTAAGPKPQTTATVPSEAANQILDSLNSTFDNINLSGEIIITLTEAQLTSLLVEQLATQDDLLIQNPQVFIRNNQVEITGDVQKGPINLKAHLYLTAGINQMGELQVTLVSVDFGGIPVPDSYLNSISSTIDSIMTGYIQPMTSGYKIMQVVLTEGTISITCKKQ